jgi:tRNA (guanine-N7-)-methyltransferase
VLAHMFGPGSLTGVRVFFPDPWPKSRHHKRRLLQPDTVALIADRLRPGGLLHAATDHMGYAEQIAEVGDAEPRLCRVSADRANDDDPAGLPMSTARPVTKYERKALAGPTVAELLWERVL